MNHRSVVAAVLFPLAMIAGAATWRAAAAPSPRFVRPDTIQLHPRDVAQIDGKTYALSVCRLEADAPALPIVDAKEKAAPWVAAAPDGGVYALDTDKKLRHYTRSPGVACELVLDRTFGLVDVSRAGDAHVYVAADGIIYLSTAKASWRLEGRELVPLFDAPARASLSSRSLLVGSRDSLHVWTEGQEPRDLALLPFVTEGPLRSLHNAIALLGDDVVVHEQKLGVEGEGEHLAVEAPLGARHLGFSGMHRGTQRCSRDHTDPTTLLHRVTNVAREGRETWVYAGRGQARLWRFDASGVLQENVDLELEPQPDAGDSSAGRGGTLWLSGAEATRTRKDRFTGVLMLLAPTSGIQGWVEGRPFVARDVSFDDDEDLGWAIRLRGDEPFHVVVPFVPRAGAVTSSGSGGGPLRAGDEATRVLGARYRVAITRWDGLADGSLTIDLPDTDTFLTGDFSDARIEWTRDASELASKRLFSSRN